MISQQSKRNLQEWKRGFAFFAAHPDGVVNFGWFEQDNHEEFIRQFRLALHDKINRAGKLPVTEKKWRKLTATYFYALRRDADRLRAKLQSRIRVYQWETGEMRTRFDHLLSDKNDLF